MRPLPRRLKHGEEATLVEPEAPLAAPTIRTREFLARPSAVADPTR
jgi:hypothetical protein